MSDALHEEEELGKAVDSRLLRRLYAIRLIEDGPSQLLAFVELRRKVAARDVVADEALARLVREEAITPVMATSLMNDNEHTRRITELLLEAAERLFVRRGTPLAVLGSDLLGANRPQDTYDDTLALNETAAFIALGGGTLTGEMRRIEREDHGQEEEDQQDR